MNLPTPEECEALEKSTVDWIHNGHIKHIGLVAGCDPNLGISIVNADNKKEYLTCLPGPAVKEHKYFSKSYEELFNMTFKMIKKGIFDVDKTNEVYNENRRIISAGGDLAPCPFK